MEFFWDTKETWNWKKCRRHTWAGKYRSETLIYQAVLRNTTVFTSNEWCRQCDRLHSNMPNVRKIMLIRYRARWPTYSGTWARIWPLDFGLEIFALCLHMQKYWRGTINYIRINNECLIHHWPPGICGKVIGSHLASFDLFFQPNEFDEHTPWGQNQYFHCHVVDMGPHVIWAHIHSRRPWPMKMVMMTSSVEEDGQRVRENVDLVNGELGLIKFRRIMTL